MTGTKLQRLVREVLLALALFGLALLMMACQKPTEPSCIQRRHVPILWAGVATPAIRAGLAEVSRITGLYVAHSAEPNWRFEIDSTLTVAAKGQARITECEHTAIRTVFQSQQIAERAGTVLHELGHGLGLCPSGADAWCHTTEPQGIMNPDYSRTVLGEARFSSSEEALLRRLYH